MQQKQIESRETMATYYDQLILTSNGTRVTYHNITDQIRKIVNKSKITNGICVVSSPHTTCSVVFEEFVHDTDFNGDEYIQVDLNRILNKLIPRQLTESDYLYPGQAHVDFLHGLDDPDYPTDEATILNADAHLRATLFGSSENFVLKDNALLIGSVGYIYFIDWDQNRVRDRKCNIMIVGD